MQVSNAVSVNSLWGSNNLGQGMSALQLMGDGSDYFKAQSIDKVNISMLGQLGSAASHGNQTDLPGMESFFQEIIQSVEDGTFDAAEMAENGPEALKTFAEENNIDLESLLAEQAENVEERHMFMAPPPPPANADMQEFMSNLSDDELEELNAFRDEIIQSVEDGAFDAAEMAENASETLKTFAEENNIDLESLLSIWEEETQNLSDRHHQMIFPGQILYGVDGNEATYSSHSVNIVL